MQHPFHHPTEEHAMTAKNLFDDLSQKFSELLANSPARDIEKNAKALMS